jgi:hypothetical protein
LILATVAFLVLCSWNLANADKNYSFPLSLKDRVRFQRAIEEVYWSHRIWPKENNSSKPSLQQFLSEISLEEKVQDYLKKSNALEIYWQRPILAEHLQAEIDRMVRQSKRPEMLVELFTALGNDPYLIAECLARPALAERFIRNSYAYDNSLHGELRTQAEKEFMRFSSATEMARMNGHYSESEWVRIENQGKQNLDKGNVIVLNNYEWLEWESKLRSMFSPAQLNRISRLKEDENSFYVVAIKEKEPDRILLATVTWSKVSFNEWWNSKAKDIEINVREEFFHYSLGTVNPGTNCSSDNWDELPDVPDARYGHTAVWTGSEMIIWGGRNSTPFLNTGSRYNPATDTWLATSTGANVPSPRSSHSAVWTGTEMIVWGGGSDSFSSTNTGGRYNPLTDTWTATSIGAGTPEVRLAHSAIWTGSEMVIWGGIDPPNLLNTGGKYNPFTDTWTATSTGSNVPSARSLHTAVWTGTEMIIWGGDQFLNTGGRYFPSTDTWLPTSTGANAPSARDHHTAIWTGTEMIVWGGYPGMNTGARYNPSSDTWSTTSTGTNVPSSRFDHSAVWIGTEMIIWGGEDFTGDATNTGSRYNPSSDSWSLINSGSNNPEARSIHTAVWTGNEMIVWGGLNNITQTMKTGGRYNPSSDTWIPTSGGNIPSSRSGHTAVWTGTEMIIWGGSGETTTNTGGRYNPSTDNWTPTSTGANTPSARAGQKAVWTGTEMIIWGGLNSTQMLNTGGRYNPLTDTWIKTSTGTNVPSGRFAHIMVWTGNEMIVWGGATVSTVLNTGGRYNPSTDSWIPTSIGTNVPVARGFHSGIWTGSEMIVWGGQSIGFGLVNSGGRYNPSTDTWIATSTGVDVPSARSNHIGVWTGNKMIVWGGEDDNSELNTGGLYNPNNDSWDSTNTGVDVPSARSDHSGIWTGTEMIVWGGSDTTSQLNTGGAYNPLNDAWRATSIGNGVPVERSKHTSVWTGTQMIIWGGYDGNSTINSGSSYCACSITITPPTLPPGIVGVLYSETIIADGGNPPYVYSVSNGALPDGLSLNSSTGEISGTPTLAGTFDFTITASDGGTCVASQNYSIDITEAGSCLFCDDFEDGVLATNWTYIKNSTSWLESSGSLIGTNSRKTTAIATPAFAGCVNCYVESTMQSAGGVGNRVWLLHHFTDNSNYIELIMKEESDRWILKQRIGKKVVAKAKVQSIIDPNTTYVARITYDGNIYRVSINGMEILTLSPAGPVTGGTVGFKVKRTTGTFQYISVNL